MLLIQQSPTKMYIKNASDEEILRLQKELSYVDKSVKFELAKHKQSHWFRQKHGEEAWQARLEELKAEMNKCLLHIDDTGIWTYCGITHHILKSFPQSQVIKEFKYPEYNEFISFKQKPLEPYPYQKIAEALIREANHAGVEIATGLGKSLVIVYLVGKIGLKTVVMAPSRDIALRLYSDFVAALGEHLVGFIGDGKKKTSKLITVGISASLTNVKPGSKEWDDLSQAEVFVADESHLCPAATLERVCHGLVAKAPYRFFFSATQMRGDGRDLMLQAITGPIVFRKTLNEGMDEGYLSRLHFWMINTTSSSNLVLRDPNECTREHLYYNKNVIKSAAELANKFVKSGKAVLILVEELEQFTKLHTYLNHEFRFAHSGVTKENKKKVPELYHKSDPTQLVKDFNDEQFPILIGTSCITTGTDVKANEVTIYLQGGQSEIQIMQGACGRSTRLFTFKDGRKKKDCIIIDFDVENNEVCHRHATARKDIYQLYGVVNELKA